MPKKMDKEKLESYRRLDEQDTKDRVRLADFPTKNAYDSFRNWQKRETQKAGRKATRQQEKIGSRSLPPQPPIDLSPFFPQWQSMTETEKNFLRAGYSASLDCAESGHKAQLWRAFAKAGFPDQFTDRDRRQTFTPDEYKEAVEHLFPTDNTDSTVLKLIAAHIEQNGGKADPDFIAALVSMQKEEG